MGLSGLCAEELAESPGPSASALLEREADAGLNRNWAVESQERLGPPSGFMYPDFNGKLYEVEKKPALRLRCRIGHAWSGDALSQEHDIAVEEALSAAMRTIEERAELSLRFARRAERGLRVG